MRIVGVTMIRSALAAFAAVFMLWASALWADENAHPSYPELGITTSGPSIGYWWGRTGLRFTGMYRDKDHHEFHLNIGYAFVDSATAQQSINLLTSWVAGSDPGHTHQAKPLAVFRAFPAMSRSEIPLKS